MNEWVPETETYEEIDQAGMGVGSTYAAVAVANPEDVSRGVLHHMSNVARKKKRRVGEHLREVAQGSEE